jgi:hypothetical protein
MEKEKEVKRELTEVKEAVKRLVTSSTSRRLAKQEASAISVTRRSRKLPRKKLCDQDLGLEKQVWNLHRNRLPQGVQ